MLQIGFVAICVLSRAWGSLWEHMSVKAQKDKAFLHISVSDHMLLGDEVCW